MKNKIFAKCPICGENGVVEPGKGTKDYRVFKCSNEHIFKKERERPQKQKEKTKQNVPEWIETLEKLSKEK